MPSCGHHHAAVGPCLLQSFSAFHIRVHNVLHMAPLPYRLQVFVKEPSWRHRTQRLVGRQQPFISRGKSTDTELHTSSFLCDAMLMMYSTSCLYSASDRHDAHVCKSVVINTSSDHYSITILLSLHRRVILDSMLCHQEFIVNCRSNVKHAFANCRSGFHGCL